MKIVTFNINSVRARIENLKTFLQKHSPDILGLQEIKVTTSDFPTSAFTDFGYHIIVHGQKSYHGVALFSKVNPDSKQAGIDFEEQQARFVYAKYNTDKGIVHLVNCYFPQGENKNHKVKFPYKQRFYAGITEWLSSNFDLQTDKVVLIGDYNIAPQDCDIGIGEENRKRWLRTGKCSFLPEEREMFQTLVAMGLFDPYRKALPSSNDFFSWFDYRSRGFEDNPKRGLRIDYALCSKPMLDLFLDVKIDYETRASNKPSDHAPVIYEFDLDLI